MIYESPAVFNPPEFNDDAPSPDGPMPSGNIQMPQPAEAQETTVPEPVAATAETTEMQGDLEIGTPAQDNIAPDSAKDEGYLDTSGAHESTEKLVFGPQEEMSAPSFVDDQPTEELSSPAEEIKEEVADEEPKFLDKKREDVGEDEEKESSNELCERFVEDSIMELVDYSPDGDQVDEESFVKHNLGGIKIGMQESLRMIQSGRIDFEPKEYNENPFDPNIIVVGRVLDTALRIGIAQRYAKEHPETAGRLAKWNPESFPLEETDDERFRNFIYHTADEKKHKHSDGDTFALVASGLSTIARGAESAARKNFEKRQMQEAETKKLMQETSEIIANW